jgi:FtsP/CotA-like multicopper oxidase with cupredoxin domain
MNQRLSLGMAFALLGFVLACRSSTPSSDSRKAPPPGPGPSNSKVEAQVVDTPPADVSHGEARIGGPSASPAPFDARVAPAEPARLRRIRLEVSHQTIEIAPGVKYAAWTFDGTVPGPPLHIRQGDTVAFTLVNRANMPHSMDFHAAEIAPSKYYVNVLPGDSLQYRFVAASAWRIHVSLWHRTGRDAHRQRDVWRADR